jgi:hypothetical protein
MQKKTRKAPSRGAQALQDSSRSFCVSIENKNTKQKLNVSFSFFVWSNPYHAVALFDYLVRAAHTRGLFAERGDEIRVYWEPPRRRGTK